MRFDAFVNGSYESQSLIADCEQTINWYPEIMESAGAKSPMVLYPSPGVGTFATTTQGSGRAAFSEAAEGGRVFMVAGTKLYEVFENGTVIERGTVAQNGDPAQIVTNGDGGGQLLIVSGGNAYSYTLATNVLSAIASLAGKATQCGYSYGYGLVFDKQTGTVFMSDLFDFQVFDPLNFFQRSIGSDDWVSMLVTSWGQIALLGSKTREYWGNTGAFPIPFAPSTPGVQTEGIAATFAIVESVEHVVWLGTTRGGGYTVYAARGFRAEEISDKAVAFFLSTCTRLSDVTIEAYNDHGHQFVLLNVPSEDRTLCYDFATQRWHYRLSLRATGVQGSWRPAWHAFGFNRHLWADRESGRILVTDHTLAVDVEDREIRRERTGPSICYEHQELDFGTFELLMQVGIGNTNPPATNPQIVLQRSDDGGRTYGNEQQCSVGREGDYRLRVKWEANGSARDRAYKVICSDPVIGWVIVTAFVEVADERGRQIPLGRAA